MRTSHQLVRKRILDEKSKITDEEFFTSKEYQAYLTDISEAATKRYKHPMPVRVVADHDDSYGRDPLEELRMSREFIRGLFGA